MDISTEVLSFHRYGNIFEILQLLKIGGFDAYDFTMFGADAFDILIDKEDYIERAEKVRKFSDDLGIKCNQTHAIFPVIKRNDSEYNEKTFKSIVRSLEVGGILGAKACVVHPCNDYSAEQNFGIYQRLLPFAKKNDVKIALENMWNWDDVSDHAIKAACSDHADFKKHLDLLDEKWFIACLDLGHAEMKGLNTSAVRMIETLGKRLKALHIHGNDRHHDLHQLPYVSDVDFEPIIDALVKVGYDGDITFEADTYMPGFPIKLYPAAARLMYEIGVYFKNEINTRQRLNKYE